KPQFASLEGGSVRGFSAYLRCPPLRPVTLSFVTQHGTTSVEVAAPAPTSEPAYNPRFERFIAMMKERAGTVLEIGARVVGPGSALKASKFQPECRFLGC